MTKYLIDDQPLIVLPKLAQRVGLNESLFLQQLHYWLLQKRNIRDGYYWAFNSYPEWLKQFPFWSESTLKRTVNSLEKSGLVITGNYNSMKIDKTKWYRIDYKVLKEITSDIEEFDGKASNDESVQNDLTNGSKRTDEDIDLNRPIPEITTETTTKNKTKDKTVPDKSETEKILNDLFEKWYNLYDHKKGRPKAFSAFKVCLQTKKYDIGTLIDKTYEYINGEGLDKKYRKHPSTFLNQYHPDDDYTKQNGNVNKPKNNFMEALNERAGSSNFINNDSKLLSF